MNRGYLGLLIDEVIEITPTCDLIAEVLLKRLSAKAPSPLICIPVDTVM